MSIWTRLVARKEIIALGLCLSVASMGSILLPFWVGVVPASGLLSQVAAGRLGSGELLATAFANVAVSAFGHRLDLKRTAFAGGALAVLANLLAAFGPGAASLIAGRLGSGLGFGVLLAMAMAGVARQERPQRALSTTQFIMLPFLSLVALVAPRLVAAGGLRMLFAFATLCAIASAVAALGFPSARESGAEGSDRAAARAGGRIAPAAAGLGVAAFFAALGTMTTYLVPLGARAGLAPQVVGALISATMILNLAAPLAAVWLGERVGLTRPIFTAILVMLVDALALAAISQQALFGLGVLLLYIGPVFIVPYQIGLLAKFDPSGRYAGAGPAFMMFGGAVGPALGAPFVAMGQPAVLGPVAAGVLVLSAAAFAISIQVGSGRLKKGDLIAKTV